MRDIRCLEEHTSNDGVYWTQTQISNNQKNEETLETIC